jgi:hypothetical protein
MVFAERAFRSFLEPGEEILEVFHRHPVVMVKKQLEILVFGVFVPLFLWYLFPEFVLFFTLWLVISVFRILYTVVGWYFDSLLLTNVSILDVYWNGFFDRSSSRLEYPMIEGISYAIQGFRRTVFNYGHVHINRSGGSSVLDLPDAVNPPKVERVILSHQEKFVSEQSIKDSDTLKSLLVTMIRHHNKNGGVPEAEIQVPDLSSATQAEAEKDAKKGSEPSQKTEPKGAPSKPGNPLNPPKSGGSKMPKKIKFY